MTPAQRLALACAFMALQERIAAKPVMPAHPVVKRHYVSSRARRNYKRHEEKYIAE